MRFFVGLHQPSDAPHFGACFVSVNRLRSRRTFRPAGDWIMDSGAFTELLLHGTYRHSVAEYAAECKRWSSVGNLLRVVAQDFMCEPFMLARTGLSVAAHQRLTIERFDALDACDVGAQVMPVLQGFEPAEYVAHVHQYGARLRSGHWVGVGSVCKRNARPEAVLAVLLAIKNERSDLRLHGFGLKQTALSDPRIVGLLYSADSMAWSYAARKQGRNANDRAEAARFAVRVGSSREQFHLFGAAA